MYYTAHGIICYSHLQEPTVNASLLLLQQIAKKLHGTSGTDPVYVSVVKQVSTLVLECLQLNILPENKPSNLKKRVSEALCNTLGDWSYNSLGPPFGMRQHSLHQPEIEIKVCYNFFCYDHGQPT